MLLKYFKTLFANKSLIIILLICHMMSFAATSYAYAFAKKTAIIYDGATIDVYGKNGVNFEFRQADALWKDFKAIGLADIYHINFEFGKIAYENKLGVGEKLDFDSDKRQVAVEKTESAGLSLGDKVTFFDMEFEVVDLSARQTYFNYYAFSGSTVPIKSITVGKALFRLNESDLKKIDDIAQKSSISLFYNKDALKKDGQLAQMIESPLFFIIFAVIALCLVTTSVLNFFAISSRVKFFNVLRSFGVSSKTKFRYIFLEQTLIFLPLFLAGTIVYFITYIFTKDIIALLSFIDIMFIAITFSLIMVFLILINLLIMRRKQNV